MLNIANSEFGHSLFQAYYVFLSLNPCALFYQHRNAFLAKKNSNLNSLHSVQLTGVLITIFSLLKILLRKTSHQSFQTRF